MGKFELYNIDLKNLTPGVHEFDYHLENKFFLDIDGDQVQKGVVIVSCDRCLDDMEQPVESDNRLVVKFGKEYSEENDEIVIIPEEEGKINIAWFLFEFIALSIPMKHVHAPGKCNKAMASKLRQHTARSVDEDDDFDTDFDDDVEDVPGDDQIDPRWAALKNLVENNNN